MIKKQECRDEERYWEEYKEEEAKAKAKAKAKEEKVAFMDFLGFCYMEDRIQK